MTEDTEDERPYFPPVRDNDEIYNDARKTLLSSEDTNGNQEDTGMEGCSSMPPFSSEQRLDEEIEVPQSFDVAVHKFNLKPDISLGQRHEFEHNQAFFGVHVVNSNTKRTDNFRTLNAMDLCDDYDLIPTRRHRGNQIRQRVITEYQACRSNPEIGGFDRKLQRAVIKREDVDVRQVTGSMNNGKKKTGILHFLGRKKGG